MPQGGEDGDDAADDRTTGWSEKTLPRVLSTDDADGVLPGTFSSLLVRGAGLCAGAGA